VDVDVPTYAATYTATDGSADAEDTSAAVYMYAAAYVYTATDASASVNAMMLHRVFILSSPRGQVRGRRRKNELILLTTSASLTAGEEIMNTLLSIMAFTLADVDVYVTAGEGNNEHSI
jgi:hypothetical protein